MTTSDRHDRHTQTSDDTKHTIYRWSTGNTLLRQSRDPHFDSPVLSERAFSCLKKLNFRCFQKVGGWAMLEFGEMGVNQWGGRDAIFDASSC